MTVDRRKIDLKEPIKTAGVHTISVKLHREVVAEVKLTVKAAGVPVVAADDVEDEKERVPNAMDDYEE